MDWTPLRPEQVFDADRIDWLRGTGHWKQRVLSQLVDEWADATPDVAAAIDDERQLTIGELRDAAWRMARALSERGVGRGDRVVVQLTNRVEAVAAICAVTRLGAVLVPVQPALRKHDVGSILERTEPVAIVSIGVHRGFDHREMLRELLPDAPSVREVVIVGADPEEFTAYDDLLAAEPYDGPMPDPDDPMLVIFTSGTTAKPKGCVHTGNTFLFTGYGTSAALGVTSEDVVFMPSPVMHTTGMVVGVLIPFVTRTPTVLQAIWEPGAALDMIAKHRCTLTLGATAFATMFLNAFDPDRHDMSSMRVFGLAGAPIPAETVARVQREFGLKVVTLYGSTEALIVTATRPTDDIERIASSDGAPTSGVELQITDPAGVEVPRGTEGEIRLKSPGRFVCYWADDELTRAAVDDEGRLMTGDLARMDEAGYIRLTGRKADVIIRGGMNISPAEVEGLLVEHPRVAEVAIVAMPDQRLGEKSCAFVVPVGEPPALEDLVAFLSDRGIAKYKYPERLEIVDALPRNPTGKIEKFRLRSEIAALVGQAAGA